MMEAKQQTVGKYQYVCERLMEHREVLEELQAFPNLPTSVVDFILGEFDRVGDYIDDAERDGESADHVYGGEGRIAYGQSHESAFEDLVEAWGLKIDELTRVERDYVETVYDKFFTE